ncbi:MAG: hypothetical protein U5K33_06135 [Halofilum sp. (in: g-proteobacteria)]|nr:hypothetical protein [Halofilum sp. (in: g-proteobacteria)]
MSMPAIEWRQLRVPGAFAAAALAVLMLVVYAGSAWLSEREDAYNRARSDLARAASQYRSASDDSAVYDQYATRFRDLEESGLIGEERRLAWIEALQSANRELRLPTLRYEITPREAVSLSAVDVGSQYIELYRSTMTLEIGALHEGDVLSLLRSLAGERAGIMETESCLLRRARPAGSLSFDPRVANLDVSCRLHWYTLVMKPEGGA